MARRSLRLSSLDISVPVTAPLSAYFRFSEEHDNAAAAGDDSEREAELSRSPLFPRRHRSVHLARPLTLGLLARSAARLPSHVASLYAAHLCSRSPQDASSLIDQSYPTLTQATAVKGFLLLDPTVPEKPRQPPTAAERAPRSFSPGLQPSQRQQSLAINAQGQGQCGFIPRWITVLQRDTYSRSDNSCKFRHVPCCHLTFSTLNKKTG